MKLSFKYGHLVQRGVGVGIQEKRRIFQHGFRGHDTMTFRSVQTFLNVLKPCNSTICNDRNIHSLTNRSNHVPITFTDKLFLLLLGSSVNRQNLTTRRFQHLGKFNRFLLCLEETNFTCNGNLEIGREMTDDSLQQIGFFQQKGTVMTLTSDTLRTSCVLVCKCYCVNIVKQPLLQSTYPD